MGDAAPDGAAGVARPVVLGAPSGPPEVESLTDTQQARRLRIVRAALGLLEARPYDSIQMREVAEAARVALGTVYRYFSSKEQLFAAVLIEWASDFAVDVRREPLPGESDAERLSAALCEAAAAFDHRPQFYGVITVLEAATDPHVTELYDGFTVGTRLALAETLHDVPAGDVEAVLDLVASVLDSALRAWSLGRLSMDDARARLCRSVDLVFSGPPHAPA